MPTNSFTSKRLRVTIVLANSANVSFTGSGDNTLTLVDNRMSAKVIANAREAVKLDLKIWGMRQLDMDALTAAWLDPNAIRSNQVVVEADSGNGFLPVFTGIISEAQPDYNSAPNVSFHILAFVKYFQQVNTVEPLSFKGPTDISVMGKYLADKLGLSYEQTPGLKSVINNPSFPGSVWTQLLSVCKAANVDFYFLGEKLVITPLNLPLTDKPSVILSPTTGLLGYPVYTSKGLEVRAIYDSAFQCATPITIQDSLVKGANGVWHPVFLMHQLESVMPNGKWNSVLQCLKVPV